MFYLNATARVKHTGLNLTLLLVLLLPLWTGCDFLDSNTGTKRAIVTITPPSSKFTSMASKTVPVDGVLYAYCTNQSGGETVKLSGELEVIFETASSTEDRRIVIRPIAVRAEGLASGQSFQSPPGAQEAFPFDQSPLAFGYGLWLYGQGTELNLKLNQPLEIEVNDENQLSVFTVSPSVEGCSERGEPR